MAFLKIINNTHIFLDNFISFQIRLTKSIAEFSLSKKYDDFRSNFNLQYL